jgi:CRISPR-associated protein Cas2
MARTRYLVSYDIANPKRLRRVARVLEGFGSRLQFSVFECPLDPLRLATVKAELAQQINHDEDQVLFVSLGPAATEGSLSIESLGKAYKIRRAITVI